MRSRPCLAPLQRLISRANAPGMKIAERCKTPQKFPNGGSVSNKKRRQEANTMTTTLGAASGVIVPPVRESSEMYSKSSAALIAVDVEGFSVDGNGRTRVPSWNVTPGRSLNVQVLKSSECVQLSASRGCASPLSSRAVSVSKMSAAAVRPRYRTRPPSAGQSPECRSRAPQSASRPASAPKGASSAPASRLAQATAIRLSPDCRWTACSLPIAGIEKFHRRPNMIVSHRLSPDPARHRPSSGRRCWPCASEAGARTQQTATPQTRQLSA